jgi:hypothetical protein
MFFDFSCFIYQEYNIGHVNFPAVAFVIMYARAKLEKEMAKKTLFALLLIIVALFGH